MAPILIEHKNFQFRSKVVGLDFDWTLVMPKDNKTFPKDVDDWQWLRASVPTTLKKYYDEGYCLVIFSNQSKGWKLTMIENVMKAIDLPILAVVAYNKQDYKPNPNLFLNVVPFKKVNTDNSFYVGDALGRKNDYSDSDKVFAENVGISIKCPEDVFLLHNNTNEDNINIDAVESQEIIIMCGYPGSGKSTIADKVFGTNTSYVILSGDLLKTSSKMTKAAKSPIADGKSVIFDATNMTRAKRAEYINCAQNYNILVRCIYVATSMEESMFRNNKRPKENIVPKIAYYVMRKKFEPPSENEGFTLLTV